MPDPYWSIRTLDVYERQNSYLGSRIFIAVVAIAAIIGSSLWLLRYWDKSGTGLGGGQDRFGVLFTNLVDFAQKAMLPLRRWMPVSTGPEEPNDSLAEQASCSARLMRLVPSRVNSSMKTME